MCRSDGATCISTIHSPPPQAFAFFDTAIVLAHGHVAYAGDVFGENGVVSHFQQSGYSYDPRDNLADYLITITAKEDVNWPEFYQRSKNHQQNSEAVALASSTAKEFTLEEEKAPSPLRKIFHALKVLIKYRTRANYKDVDFVMARVADKVGRLWKRRLGP
eukprot:scaffold4595_cov415-Prasinococcus_capsulatus_cf.AAC.5